MNTMKAAVVHAFGQPLQIEDVPVPAVTPGQVLVKVVASGVCHTDLHAADGDWPVKPTLPFIPGHEGVGYVAALGSGVKGIKEGDRVGVPWLHTACGRCEHCITGWETLCDEQQMTGYTVNGGYAEYVLADPGYVGHLPANVTFGEIAPVLCAGVTVYKGLKVLDCKPGDWVAISGVGGLGHYAVQYAKAMGFHVIAVDIDDAKLALATRVGADMVINASTTRPRGRGAAHAARRARGARHRSLAHGVLSGARHAAQARHDVAGGPSAGRLRAADLRRRARTRKRCAARSSARARTCRRRSISPARERFAASAAKTGSTTSTPSSPGSSTATSKAGW